MEEGLVEVNQTMKAAVLDRPLSIQVRDVQVPVPQPDQALVKVHCIGICGSDIHYYEHGRIGRYVVERPIILGHELAGDVVAVGENVTQVAIGDRVAVEPGVPCNTCQYCKAGRYNLCRDVVFMATPPIDGAWAEYVAIRADFLHKLPDTISYEEGALLEPLSVGIHAMKRGRVGPGDKILISGLGPIGILAATAAKLFGAGQVIGSDMVDLRHRIAMDLGVDAVVNPSSENLIDRIGRLTDGDGVNVVIETSGNARAVADTIQLVNPGGRIVIIGLPSTNEISVDIPTLVDKELDVYGVFRYANTYPTTIQALRKGTTDIRRVITQRFTLADIQEACEVARLSKDKSVKVMIYPGAVPE